MRVLRTQGIESEAPLAFAALQRLLRPLMPLAEAFLPSRRRRCGWRSAWRAARAPATGSWSSSRRSACSPRPPKRSRCWWSWMTRTGSTTRRRRPCCSWRGVSRSSGWRCCSRLGSWMCGPSTVGELPTLRLAGLDLAATTGLLQERASSDVSPAVAAQLLESTGGNPLALVEMPQAALVGPAGRAGEPARAASGHRHARAGLPRPSPTALARCAAAAARGCRGRLDAARHRGECRGRDGRRPGRPGRGGALRPRAGHRGQGRAEAPARPVRRVRRRHEHRPSPRARRPGRCPASCRTTRTGAPGTERTSVDQPDAGWSPTSRAPPTAPRHEEVTRPRQRRGSAQPSSVRTPPGARNAGSARLSRAWLAGRPGQSLARSRLGARDRRRPAAAGRRTGCGHGSSGTSGSVKVAHRMLLEAARDVVRHDADRARELAMVAAAIAAFDGDSGVDVDPATFATIPTDGSQRQRCYAELTLGLGRWSPATGRAPRTMLRTAFATGVASTSTTWSCCPTSAIAALHVGDTLASADYHERLLTTARSSGAVVTVLYALTRLAFSDVPNGHWSTAVAQQQEALPARGGHRPAGPGRDAARDPGAALGAPR